MRLSKAIIPLVLLIAVCLPLTAAEYASRTERGWSGSSISGGLNQSAAENVLRDRQAAGEIGATPEMTQAEVQVKAEESFQKRLVGLKDALDSIERRILEMRRETSAPSHDNVERVNRDLSLVDDELQKSRPLGLSALTQVQWSDLADRAFNLKMSYDVMLHRWDSNLNIFGMSFFKNTPPAVSLDQRPVPENYRMRAGDKVVVTVLSRLGGHDEHTLVIDNTGSITVPGIGKVSAAGKTAGQLEAALTQKIGSRFSQLSVQVAVTGMSSIQVQVSGEVTRPGTYLVSGMATVFNALYEAGGPTKSGSFRKVYLVRSGESRITIDLYDFLISGSKKQDLPLKDGDLVFVSPVGPTVTVSGEVVRPGRYEPTFPTTLGAILKMAGGAKSGGYLQAVQVERVVNNEYKVLLNQPISADDTASNFAIQPGDEIVVSSVKQDKTNQVSISGPVKAPGLYGFQEKMRLSDLVKLSQGFATGKEVYGGRADIVRVDSTSGTSIVSVNLDRALNGDQNDDIELRKLDSVFIYEPDQVVFRPKLVTVAGATARPGTYRRSGGMKVSDAIAAAGGVLPYAYLERADLMRLDAREESVLVRVDLQAALNGDPEANIELQDRDRLMVYSMDEVRWRDSRVRIEGAVQRPGTYVRAQGMRISDLLFAAGGLLPEAASTIEIARYTDTEGSLITRVELMGQRPNSDRDIILEDRDVVTVPAVNPRLRTPEVVYLSGEVANPGPYVLTSQDEKLVDVIKRAGGLTKQADMNGLMFLRRKSSLEKPQQELDSDVILQKSRMFADKQFLTQLAKSGVTLPANFMQSGNKSVEELAKPTEVIDESDPNRQIVDPRNNGSTMGTEPGADTRMTISNPAAKDTEITRQETLLDLLRARDNESRTETALGRPVTDAANQNTLYGGKTDEKGFVPSDPIDYLLQGSGLSSNETSRISINLSFALKDQTSPDNLTLRDGDKICVPKISNVVTVIGAVLHPHSFAAGEGKSVEYYIGRSGGFSQEASKGDVVVVRTNGDALPMRAVKSVMPGDVIVVPTTGLIDISKKWEKVGSITKVVSDILSSVFVLTRF